MKARVSNLYRTEIEWDRLNFIPLQGELIVYAPDNKHKYARAKLGDGATALQNLPFFTDSCIDEKLAEFQFLANADAGRISDYF